MQCSSRWLQYTHLFHFNKEWSLMIYEYGDSNTNNFNITVLWMLWYCSAIKSRMFMMIHQSELRENNMMNKKKIACNDQRLKWSPEWHEHGVFSFALSGINWVVKDNCYHWMNMTRMQKTESPKVRVACLLI